MEVRILQSSGVPQAEIEAHKEIEREFDSTPFSKNWRGYASFALARKGRGSGDDDLDLVLVTHTNVVVIELKNWHGRVLESNGFKWRLDGEDRGSSPVQVAALKAKKLASVMQQKLGREKTPFVSSYVVMHGDIGQLRLTDDESKSVLTMSEFLSFRFSDCYKQYLWGKPRLNPLDFLDDYDRFFKGSQFKGKVYYVDGFRPDSEPIFKHPKGLYGEYQAVAKDDPNTKALLRKWNFSALGLDFLAESDRAVIGLREQRVYQYVSERNEELSLGLLRPLSRKSSHDVTLDFAELFALPSNVSRLAEFANRTLGKLDVRERLVLVKALLSRFADLHDLRVAHRDVGDHSIWLDRSARVIVSGFPAAYFPELKTVGTFREKVKVDQAALPEDGVSPPDETPYRRDVFMLGVLVYLILFGEKPAKVSDTYVWSPQSEDPSGGILDDAIKRALSKQPADRFSDARDMLEAINADSAELRETIVDLEVFEAYRPATKEKDYEETEVLGDDESFLSFRSGSEVEAKLVKVWYGITPELQHQDRALRLLSFLERCRLLKGARLTGIQDVTDFGLTRGSLLLVLQWVPGTVLRDWIKHNPALDLRLKAAIVITQTLIRLHELEIVHGDVHPGNVVIDNQGRPTIIDALDFRASRSEAYTTAYLPDNYKSLSPFERDRYGLAATFIDMFDSSRENPLDGSLPIPDVYEELANILSAEVLSTLDPLLDSLEKATAPPVEDIPTFRIALPSRPGEPAPDTELRSDNGLFHVSVQKGRKDPNSLQFWVTGIGKQIRVSWDLAGQCTEYVALQDVPQSQLLRSQMMRDTAVQIRLHVIGDAKFDADLLVNHLFELPEIKRKVAKFSDKSSVKAKESDEREPETKTKSALAGVSAREIWSSLLKAEEESFPTVVIAGETKLNRSQPGQTLIPYHADGSVIDYDHSDTVLVESQSKDGDWHTCGTLNLRDTTFGQLAELAVDRLDSRANTRIGAPLRLMSILERGSLSRRRLAVERILEDKSIVPSLIDYFDPRENVQLLPNRYSSPADEDLAQYSDGDKVLNESQKGAFHRVLSNGPVSLLQGPPGTGKTWFIACLLHYLMTKGGARRILLASQSHEAVNNALEKGLELCKEKGVPFHAVRLGNESATSEEIRHLHSGSIEQVYRERFKAERRERVVKLGSSLGLPKRFCEEFVDLYYRLTVMSHTIDKFMASEEQAKDAEAKKYKNRVRALTETFWEIAVDVYELPHIGSPQDAVVAVENKLVELYQVTSVDAIERLRKVLKLSDEWLENLGSRDANFSEFLAKTRTVVSGTLVGIGYKATGVVQNIFDWVIIDEAGRAAPSELAVAMQAGQRILLVGDHKQLPPTFSQGVRELVKKSYGVEADLPEFGSDFARIFDSKYGENVGATLLMQYRMAPDIGELVSSCFYDDTLRTGRGGAPEYYEFLPQQLQSQVTWVDTSPLGHRGLEQVSDDKVHRWNTTEAHVVLGLIREILDNVDFMDFLEDDLRPNEPAIGVVCLYSKQREIIDRMLAEAVWLENRRRLIKVDTVDSYQGKENRIVILSTVRNNTARKPGFLRSPNRINVAMSRAMERLFIVGATKMWEERNKDLPLGRVKRKVFEFADVGRARILSGEEFLVK